MYFFEQGQRLSGPGSSIKTNGRSRTSHGGRLQSQPGYDGHGSDRDDGDRVDFADGQPFSCVQVKMSLLTAVIVRRQTQDLLDGLLQRISLVRGPGWPTSRSPTQIAVGCSLWACLPSLRLKAIRGPNGAKPF